MDKYEFNEKIDQIGNMMDNGNYKMAMQLADTVDWRRVKNVNLLSMVAEIYELNSEYEESKDILLMAYERAPVGKRFLYRLAEIAVKAGDFQEAVDFYKEFCEVSPDDSRQYLLRFLILQGKGASNGQLTGCLEQYLSLELDEAWLYELARLYAADGREEECIKTCDRIMLLFGHGQYVDSAMELKEHFLSRQGGNAGEMEDGRQGYGREPQPQTGWEGQAGNTQAQPYGNPQGYPDENEEEEGDIEIYDKNRSQRYLEDISAQGRASGQRRTERGGRNSGQDAGLSQDYGKVYRKPERFSEGAGKAAPPRNDAGNARNANEYGKPQYDALQGQGQYQPYSQPQYNPYDTVNMPGNPVVQMPEGQAAYPAQGMPQMQAIPQMPENPALPEGKSAYLAQGAVQVPPMPQQFQEVPEAPQAQAFAQAQPVQAPQQPLPQGVQGQLPQAIQGQAVQAMPQVPQTPEMQAILQMPPQSQQTKELPQGIDVTQIPGNPALPEGQSYPAQGMPQMQAVPQMLQQPQAFAQAQPVNPSAQYNYDAAQMPGNSVPKGQAAYPAQGVAQVLPMPQQIQQTKELPQGVQLPPQAIQGQAVQAMPQVLEAAQAQAFAQAQPVNLSAQYNYDAAQTPGNPALSEEQAAYLAQGVAQMPQQPQAVPLVQQTSEMQVPTQGQQTKELPQGVQSQIPPQQPLQGQPVPETQAAQQSLQASQSLQTSQESQVPRTQPYPAANSTAPQGVLPQQTQVFQEPMPYPGSAAPIQQAAPAPMPQAGAGMQAVAQPQPPVQREAQQGQPVRQKEAGDMHTGKKREKRQFHTYHMIIEAKSIPSGFLIAKDEIKYFHEKYKLDYKVAKIDAEKLNANGFASFIPKIVGKDLIIENAGKLRYSVVDEIEHYIMNPIDDSSIVLVDVKDRFDRMAEDRPVFVGHFDVVSDVDADGQAEQDLDRDDTGKVPLVRDRNPLGDISQGQAEEGGQESPRIEGAERQERPVDSRRKAAAAPGAEDASWQELPPEGDDPGNENAGENAKAIPFKKKASNPSGENLPPDYYEEMDMDDFANYAQDYARHIDCVLPGKTVLALYDRIELMKEEGITLNKQQAEALIEEAADKAEKPGIGKKIGGMFHPQYDKEDRLILREDNFML